MHHYGWTWEYLLWGIKWHIVEKTMIDAPSYKYPKNADIGKDGKSDDKAPKAQNTSSLRAFLNKKLDEQ